jgi:tetratricopeptide (TPR) repeat protein
MRTITFYSYKGGVGRTLALSDMAIKLSMLGKKVCILDFDLEAPGAHYKLTNYSVPTVTEPLQRKGLVDFIADCQTEAEPPLSIDAYITKFEPRNKSREDIYMIKAGDMTQNEYWQKLRGLNWHSMMTGDEITETVSILLYLKQLLQEHASGCEYLLVDARTGITDMGSAALNIMADDIVLLAANSKENFTGSAILFDKLCKSGAIQVTQGNYHVVLTRIPLVEADNDLDAMLARRLEFEFRKYVNPNFKLGKDKLSIVHSYAELEEDEHYNDRFIERFDMRRLEFLYEEHDGIYTVSEDYEELFDKLFLKGLDDAAKQVLSNLSALRNRVHELSYVEDINEQHKIASDLVEQISEYTIGREIVYYTLGEIQYKQGDVAAAIDNYKEALDIERDSKTVQFALAKCYLQLMDYGSALQYVRAAKDQSPSLPEPYLKELEILQIILSNTTDPAQLEKTQTAITKLCKTYLEEVKPDDALVWFASALVQLRNLPTKKKDKLSAIANAKECIQNAMQYQSYVGKYYIARAYISYLEATTNQTKLDRDFYTTLSIGFSLTDQKLQHELRDFKDMFTALKEDHDLLRIFNRHRINLHEIL